MVDGMSKSEIQNEDGSYPQIRLQSTNAAEYKFYATKFRVWAARHKLTETQAIEQLLRRAVESDAYVSVTEFGSYNDLADALAEHGISITRQQAYTDRLRGDLDDLFTETVVTDDSPKAKRTQKVLYDIPATVEFYKNKEKIK